MLNIFSFKKVERKELNENIKSILIGLVFIFLIFLTYYELTPQENGLESSEGLESKPNGWGYLQNVYWLGQWEYNADGNPATLS